MPTVTDQAADLNGQELHRICSLYGPPAYVKSASVADLCGSDDLAPHLYGDAMRRRFACHTPAGVWTSAAFFYEKKASEQDPTIESRIREAAAYYGILADVDRVQSQIAKSASHDESQLPDEAFAVVSRQADGSSQRRYPMRNAVEVRKAAEYLTDYRDRMPFSLRRQLADKIMQKAGEFGADLGDSRDVVHRSAGLGACSSQDVVALIDQRTQMLRPTGTHAELRNELHKVAQAVNSRPTWSHNYDNLTKLAEMLDQFDRQYRLIDRYGSDLDRPDDVLFAVTQEKVAELTDELIGSSLTGNFYKRSELQNLSLQDIINGMGEEFARAVSNGNAWIDFNKLATHLAALPRGDAELFDTAAAAAGVRPYANKAASVGQLLTDTDLKQLASSQTVSSPGSLWSRIHRTG